MFTSAPAKAGLMHYLQLCRLKQDNNVIANN